MYECMYDNVNTISDAAAGVCIVLSLSVASFHSFIHSFDVCA